MTRLLVVSLLLGFCGACATTRVVAQADYTDPNTFELLTDRFAPEDLQEIAHRLASSFIRAPYFKDASPRPRVVVAQLVNKTQEALDMDALADSLQIALFKEGGFEVVDAKARLAIAREYEYQQSGYVDPANAKGAGQQIAADFIVTGSLTSITEHAGADEIVFYKMSAIASDLRSGSVRWAEDQKIRKRVVLAGIAPETSRKLKIAGYATAGGMLLVGSGLLLGGLAAGMGFTTYTCPNPVTGQLNWTCTRGNQVDSGLAWTGAGLMISAPVVAVMTATLVPDGNPRIRTVSLAPAAHGGAVLTLGGSF